jgi:hypothetical protein
MRRHLAIGLVLLLIAAHVAGCGSTAGASSSSSSSTKRSFTAFTACLKRHGINGFGSGQPPGGGQFPNGGGQPPSGSPPSGGQPPNISSKMQKAFAACSSLAPRSGQGAFGPPGGSSNGGLS